MSHRSQELEAKIVILGLSQSGKTSIRQVVFEGFAPESTSMNPATVRINRKLFNLAGSAINLFDVGGQTNYLDEVFQQYQERTFSDVKVVIFVVDISDAANIMRSKYYFDLTIDNIKKLSENARIFIFAHKMDTVPLNKREPVFQSIKEIFEISDIKNVEIHSTSIFDGTIWDAMQLVLSYAYPRDTSKTTEIKDIVTNFGLEFLALSTTQGLILYSQPERVSGINFEKVKNELTKSYFPGQTLEYSMFTIENKVVFMKELSEDMVLTAVYPSTEMLEDTKRPLNSISEQILKLFKIEDLKGQAKMKMKDQLIEYLKNVKITDAEHLERRLNQRISFKCDICGKSLSKSLLDVAVENAENLERGIKVSSGFGLLTVELFPIHECVEGMREVPILLDSNLEYRRYENSRPV